MPKFVSPKQLKEFRREQQAKSRRDWTKDNYEGAKRLAYDLRNKGADRVALEHFREEQTQQSKRDKATEDSLRAMAYASVDGGRIQVTNTADSSEYREREGLRERIRYTRLQVDGEYQDFKIIEQYLDGKLVDERAIKL